MDAFLNRIFNSTYHPTIKTRTAVNSVELQGGKQCYLIVTFPFPSLPEVPLTPHLQLEELGELEPAILENSAKLNACDVVCYTYDSSDPDSFAYIVELRKRYPQLDELPAVYAATKADLDKTTQRYEMQPDVYTREMGMTAPLHVSSTWNSISELFVTIAEAALMPSTAYPRLEEEPIDRTNLYIASGVVVATAATLYFMWKKGYP